MKHILGGLCLGNVASYLLQFALSGNSINPSVFQFLTMLFIEFVVIPMFSVYSISDGIYVSMYLYMFM